MTQPIVGFIIASVGVLMLLRSAFSEISDSESIIGGIVGFSLFVIGMTTIGMS